MAKRMTEQEIGWLAYKLIDRHTNDYYDFNINHRMTKRLGRCNYYYSDEVDYEDLPTHVIHLAGRVAKTGDRELIEQVLLHEVAHSMEPFEDGHSKKFYDRCVSIGGLDKTAEEALLRDRGYVR